MKRIWIAFTLLAVVFALCITELAFTFNTANTVTEHIEASVRYYESNDKENSLSSISKAKDTWKTYSKKMEIFHLHDTIHNVTYSLISAEEMLEEDIEDYKAECVKAKEQLNILKNVQLPYLENIL